MINEPSKSLIRNTLFMQIVHNVFMKDFSMSKTWEEASEIVHVEVKEFPSLTRNAESVIRRYIEMYEWE